MTTLLLTYSFAPQRSPRAIQIAHLVRHSRLADLRVVAAEDSEPADEGLLSTLPTELAVTRLPWHGIASISRRARELTIKDRALVPDHFRPWARSAARALIAEAAVGRGDVIVSFGQPMSDHLAAAAVARSTGAAWIAHFSDPWVDSPFRSTIAPARAINARQERRVVTAADKVVFCSQETADLVMSKYPAPVRAKASVLPHAFDPALYGARQRAATSESLTMRYIGNFYGDRSPTPLYRGLELLLRRRPTLPEELRIELIGSFEFDQPVLPGEGIPREMVTVHPAVSYLDSLRLMSEADLLASIDAPAEASVFLPSKLVEYLGADRPILALSPSGPAAELVRRAGGVVADPGQPEQVANALATALELARTGTRPDAANEVLAEHAAPTAAARFDELVGSVARA